jgi:hypothetical protein
MKPIITGIAWVVVGLFSMTAVMAAPVLLLVALIRWPWWCLAGVALPLLVAALWWLVRGRYGRR